MTTKGSRRARRDGILDDGARPAGEWNTGQSVNRLSSVRMMLTRWTLAPSISKNEERSCLGKIKVGPKTQRERENDVDMENTLGALTCQCAANGYGNLGDVNKALFLSERACRSWVRRSFLPRGGSAPAAALLSQEGWS